jgi:hypothetical protein
MTAGLDFRDDRHLFAQISTKHRRQPQQLGLRESMEKSMPHLDENVDLKLTPRIFGTALLV